MTFINQHSYKCLLGPQARNIKENNDIYSWTVGKKQHFATSRLLGKTDLTFLKLVAPSNFHYLSQENLFFLKENFKVHKTNNTSIVIHISQLSLIGGNMKKIRQSISKCAQNDFEYLDNYKKIEDVKEMLNTWSNDYTDKYFRDFSGKNHYFYKNNFHLDCHNVFVYSGAKLMAFGTLSPSQDGYSSYVIGKALYKDFPGLSELTDFMLYYKGLSEGIEHVNMGQASKGLMFYKSKFTGSTEEPHYDGSIEI